MSLINKYLAEHGTNEGVEYGREIVRMKLLYDHQKAIYKAALKRWSAFREEQRKAVGEQEWHKYIAKDEFLACKEEEREARRAQWRNERRNRKEQKRLEKNIGKNVSGDEAYTA